ncbi:MAG: rhodanese-like domain-containing protein [Methylophilaceae bacterium]|nr:rhodanese-like domain-containing protein [Methylophilaceae bacterium]MDG1445237.1 rhodanese-like domain-containing protein [Methylophilaceae bacterium]MDG2293257.1 rhodanese-like domain-containing protein [Methylophilaceae bacterium]
MEFITSNAIFIGLAVVSGVALIWPMLTNNHSGVPSVSASEAVLLMNRARLFILDVRDEGEFVQGHINGAKHIPLANLEVRIKELVKQKNKPVLVYCQRGGRSTNACKILAKHEFAQVSSLQGGLDKWIEANMPLVKD